MNVSPSLSSSSKFDKIVKTKLLCDALTLVGFIPYNRDKVYKEEEMERSRRLTRGRFDRNKGFSADYEMLVEFAEQEYRMGPFDRIFPMEHNINYYSDFLEPTRHRNEVLWSHIENGSLYNTLSEKYGQVPRGTEMI